MRRTVFFGCLFAIYAVNAEAADQTRVVVYTLESEPELAALARTLSEAILVELGKHPELVLISESEIALLFAQDQAKHALLAPCDDADCLAKLSAAMQAEKVLTGHLGKLGDTHVVTLALSDVGRAAVERSDAASSEDIAELPRAVVALASRFFSEAAAATKEAAPQPGARRSMAVLELAAQNVEPGIAGKVTELLCIELRRQDDNLNVISRDEVYRILGYKTQQLIATCESDTQCLVEIAGALGVDYLVAGAVGRLGGDHVLTLKIMNTSEARVENRVSETFHGGPSLLPQALRAVTRTLLGKPPAEGRGSLLIFTNVDSGALSVNGSPPLNLPLRGPITDLPAGKHVLTLSEEGFYNLMQHVYVEPDNTQRVNLTLQEIPAVWYEQWWVWTIAGAVVAGSAAAIYWAAQPSQGLGSGDIFIE